MMAMTADLPAANPREDLVVHTPTRGGGPARFGPGVPLIPDIGPGILDADVYTDPERYQRERTAVLAPSWQVICRSSQIPHPGDFITWEGQGETIVLTRRRDGGVSVFHTVCQHRGARIVKEPSGCARRFSCQHPGDARRLIDRADSCLRSAPAPSAVPVRVRRRAGA